MSGVGDGDGGRGRRLAPRLLPSDQATIAILAATLAVIAGGLAAGQALWPAFTLHLALLAGFGAAAVVLAARGDAVWVRVARTVATMAVIFTLYATLRVALDVVPWEADALLSRIDRLLFLGANPALLAERRTTPAVLEFFSFVYAYFIPYLYLSLFLGLVGRPADESDELLTGLALTYAVSYLGYLLLPARGPVEYHAADFAAPLRGGRFHDLVLASVAGSGGNHGAFPSLHVGAAAYACLFDLRHNRLRGLTYVPVVLLIAVSTVFVRYHYVIDLLVGLGVAVAADRTAPRWLGAWRRGSSPAPGAQAAR